MISYLLIEGDGSTEHVTEAPKHLDIRSYPTVLKLELVKVSDEWSVTVSGLDLDNKFIPIKRGDK